MASIGAELRKRLEKKEVSPLVKKYPRIKQLRRKGLATGAKQMFNNVQYLAFKIKKEFATQLATIPPKKRQEILLKKVMDGLIAKGFTPKSVKDCEIGIRNTLKKRGYI